MAEKRPISAQTPRHGLSEPALEKDGGISKWKLALGAASLFLFIVGVKRTFRPGEGPEIEATDEPVDAPIKPEKLPTRSGSRAASAPRSPTRKSSGRS